MQQAPKALKILIFILILIFAFNTAILWLPVQIFGFENPLTSDPIYGEVALLLAFFLSYRAYQRTLETQNQQAEAFNTELKQIHRAHKKEKKRLSVVLDSGRLAFWEWNIKKKTAYFSDLWQDMIGFENHNFPQDLHAWQSRIHPADQARVQKKLLQLLSNKTTEYEDTHRLMTSTGDYIWVYDRGQTLFTDLGEIERLSCVRLDITEQKNIEEKLSLDQVLLDSTRECIAITDDQLNFIRTNPAFHQTFGFSHDELKTLSLTALLDNLQDAPPINILEMVESAGEWRGELLLHHLDGKLARASLIDIQKIHHQTTENTHYALVITDITELKTTQQELKHLAHTDIVTGLPNRNYFYTALNDLLIASKQAEEKFTLMFLDLDNFKTINDTLGHSIGDKLLKSVSQLISEQIAQDTILARVGGDEFVILCRTYTTEEQLQLVGEQLNILLKKPFKLGNHEVQIGSSIGMAIYPDHGNNQTDLLQNADSAMYDAKKAGKGQHKIFNPSEMLQ